MFAIHKPTNRKFYFPGTLPGGVADPASKIPVADLPSHPTLYGTEVKCDACSTWHKAATMHATPAGPGLTCAACCRAQQPASEQHEPDTQEKALRKARALLRLATSSNPEEAAAAAAKAQELIDRHRLNIATAQLDEAATVESDEPIEDFSHDPLFPGERTLDRWKGHLSIVIAKLNQCFAYTNGGAVNLVGRASDVQTARYFISYLTAEIERLANAKCRGTSRSYWNNFRLGAAETVCQRLKDQRQQTVQQVKTEASTSTRQNALVLVEQSLALIEQRTQAAENFTAARVRLGKRSASRASYHHTAREAGRAAGHSIGLSRPAGTLRAGARHALT